MPKGIFIGIGGTGVTTVSKLKALLFQRTYGGDMDEMKKDCTFIFYDTDPGAKDAALEDVELQKAMKGFPIIDLSLEYIDAGPTAPYNMYTEAKHASSKDQVSQRMLEWAIEPKDENFQFPQKMLKEGAGAQRMAGRTGFMNCRRQFEEKIQTGIKTMQSLQGQKENITVEHPAIWVFSSCCGGTSSSALLDVMYLADRLFRQNVADVNPYMRLVLYMPKTFIEKNKDNSLNYSRNAYATMWELNEFRCDFELKGDGKKFGAFAALPDRDEWKRLKGWPVCSYVMAIDTESNNNGIVSLDQMFANTAELCYFLHTGAAGRKMISALDNDFATDGPFFKNTKKVDYDPFEWSRFLIGSGYRAITKADDYLKEYVKTRFMHDLFGQGMLGLEFEKVIPNEEDRKSAVKEFADEYILKHLGNFVRFEQSPKGSLYEYYMSAFETVALPSEIDIPSKEDWNNMGSIFTSDCKTKTKALRSTFDSPLETKSKTGWLKVIENSVKEGIEKSIVEHGLNYTYDLIDRVDDQYCQTEVLNSLKLRNNLAQLEDDIYTIIQDSKPKKGLSDLIQKMKEYKEASIRELAIEHIQSILVSITQSKTGLLEYLRRGDQEHKGIAGMISSFTESYSTSSLKYKDLASTFKGTKSEVCSDYFPHIDEFVGEGSAWKRGNLFEDLYSSIVPLETGEDAIYYGGSTSLGRPPQRNGEKGLSAILLQIKSTVPNHSCLFADMALSNPQTEYANLARDLHRHISRFIDNAINSSNYRVKTWLDKNLESIFSESFLLENGEIDTAARQKYVTQFTNSIPVFYPTRVGAMPTATSRWIYVGATEDFAKIMGFQDNDTKQYIADNNIGNRFLVCKLEVGHNFLDYKHFDTVSSLYETQRRDIEMLKSGCHIHQAFVFRDIQKAFNEKKNKRFRSFIELCWYDSFFDVLNSLNDKNYIKVFFGEESGLASGPMGPMAGPMAGPMGPLGPMDGPMGPLGPMDGPMGPLGPMDGPMGPLGPMDGPMGPTDDFMSDPIADEVTITGGNPDIMMGYKPIVSVESFGSGSVNFEKIAISGNRIGFKNEDPRILTIRLDSLESVWMDIVNEDIDYFQDYFSLFSEVYNSQSNNLKTDIKTLFRRASAIQRSANGGFSGPVWNKFFEKLRILLSTYQRTRVDDNIWTRWIQGTVFAVIKKNIFY